MRLTIIYEDSDPEGQVFLATVPDTCLTSSKILCPGMVFVFGKRYRYLGTDSAGSES